MKCTTQHNDAQHDGTQFRELLCRVSFVLSVICAECRKQSQYAECHYAECRYTECLSAPGLLIKRSIKLTALLAPVLYLVRSNVTLLAQCGQVSSGPISPNRVDVFTVVL